MVVVQIGECYGRRICQVWANPGGQWALYLLHSMLKCVNVILEVIGSQEDLEGVIYYNFHCKKVWVWL